MADLLKDAQGIGVETGAEQNTATRIGGWMEAAAGEITVTKSDITKLKTDKAEQTDVKAINTMVLQHDGELYENMPDRFTTLWETMDEKADKTDLFSQYPHSSLDKITGVKTGTYLFSGKLLYHYAFGGNVARQIYVNEFNELVTRDIQDGMPIPKWIKYAEERMLSLKADKTELTAGLALKADKANLINSLVTGGIDKPLSAEMGKYVDVVNAAKSYPFTPDSASKFLRISPYILDLVVTQNTENLTGIYVKQLRIKSGKVELLHLGADNYVNELGNDLVMTPASILSNINGLIYVRLKSYANSGMEGYALCSLSVDTEDLYGKAYLSNDVFNLNYPSIYRLSYFNTKVDRPELALKADTTKPSGEMVVYSAETAPQEGGKWVNKHHERVAAATGLHYEAYDKLTVTGLPTYETNDITVEYYFRTEPHIGADKRSDHGNIIGRGAYNVQTFGGLGIGYGPYRNLGLYAPVRDSANTNKFFITQNITNDGDFIHMVFVRKADRYSIYQDGVEVKTGNIDPAYKIYCMHFSINQFAASVAGGSKYTDVAIYRENIGLGLSADEVKQRYNNGLPTQYVLPKEQLGTLTADLSKYNINADAATIQVNATNNVAVNAKNILHESIVEKAIRANADTIAESAYISGHLVVSAKANDSAAYLISLKANKATKIRVIGDAYFYSDAAGTLGKTKEYSLDVKTNKLYIRIFSDDVKIIVDDLSAITEFGSSDTAPAFSENINPRINVGYLSSNVVLFCQRTGAYGNFIDVPKTVTYFRTSTDSSLLEGDIANLSQCYHMVLGSVGNNVTYTSTTWTNTLREFRITGVKPSAWTEAMTDQLLIDLSKATWIASGGSLNISAVAKPSSVGEAAVATLLGKGVNVTTAP